MAKPTPLEPPVTMAQRGRSELRSASPKERFIALAGVRARSSQESSQDSNNTLKGFDETQNRGVPR